jgi:hypothetical protein
VGADVQSAKSFGLLVRRYRAVAALTQEELASRAGLRSARSVTWSTAVDVNKTRIHDLLTACPAAIPAAASIRDAARTTVNGGFRQLPVADGTGWIDIADY